MGQKKRARIFEEDYWGLISCIVALSRKVIDVVFESMGVLT